MNETTVDQIKQTIRERVWRELIAANAAPDDVFGRIPAFYGAEAAADRLAGLHAWQAARVVKVVPDWAQRPVRERALIDDKLLYMAVPKLASLVPFICLDPGKLTVSPAEASMKETAARVGRKTGLSDMEPIDLIVTGCVAVNRNGARLGKGAGYSDIEVALLQEAGLIREQTIIATTMHELQLVDEPIPETAHDFRVDFIVTPTRVIRCNEPRRPTGIDWGSLTPDKIEAIPVLRDIGRR